MKAKAKNFNFNFIRARKVIEAHYFERKLFKI